ncbi:reverse transcriptase domain-containing protein [Tanacetum coccineum]
MTMRLRRYFKAHPVKVITDQPIKQILSKIEASGKLPKYVVELGAYNITFKPRNDVKGKILADFITEMPDEESLEEYFWILKVTPEKDDTEEWTLFTDGASSSKGSREGLVLIGPSGIEHTYALHLTFDNTNNEEEYKALLAGIRITRGMGIKKLEAKVDFKLVDSQINRNYIASSDSIMKYLAKAKEYIVVYERERYQHCGGRRRRQLDDLNHLISGERGMAGGQERGSQPTSPLQANYVIREIHMGHAACILVLAIHSAVPKLPKTFMTSIMAPWTFYQWGMDILGPLPQIIVTENDTQFANDPFKSWCARLNIQQMNTVVAHPQANKLVERANKSLMEGIKTRLGREKASWVDDRITMMIREGFNEEEIRLNLDLLKERRELAAIREARYQTKLEQYYNKKVHLTSFKPGDFLFRKNEASRVEDQGKLGTNGRDRTGSQKQVRMALTN